MKSNRRTTATAAHPAHLEEDAAHLAQAKSGHDAALKGAGDALALALAKAEKFAKLYRAEVDGRAQDAERAEQEARDREAVHRSALEQAKRESDAAAASAAEKITRLETENKAMREKLRRVELTLA